MEPKKDKTAKFIASGNPELDSRLGGGIPVGSLVLIEGGSGSGKSVLTQQLIWGALQDRFTISLFTSENTVKSLVVQMESIDLDILDFLLLNHIQVYPIELSHLGREATQNLISAMKKEEKSKILVVDSFTSVISGQIIDEDILGFIEGCKRLCGKGTTIIITLHSEAVEKNLIDLIRSKCDAHLQLRAEQDNQRIVKTLQVTKIRGANSVTGAIVGFEVEPGWGMRVIPISKARG